MLTRLRPRRIALLKPSALGDVVHERKANSSSPAPPEILARLRDLDLVLTGSAD